MATEDPLLDFLKRCSERLSELSSANSAELEAGALAFDGSLDAVRYLDSGQATAFEGHERVPVVSQLARMEPTALVLAAQAARTFLPWTPSHRMTDGGTQAALAPLNDVLDFDTYGVTAGLLLVGSDCEYPLHHHPPQELYLTISGTAQWRYGGADNLVSMPPDQLIYNHPHDPHRVVAGPNPVLALYVLW